MEDGQTKGTWNGVEVKLVQKLMQGLRRQIKKLHLHGSEQWA